MPQDDQKGLVQFYRGLGTIVDRTLNLCNELLSTLEELLDLYQPKSQEEANRFYRLRFDLPDCVSLLCSLREITIPSGDESHDLFAPLRDMALDVAARMVSANVLVNDIITLYGEPHEDDLDILHCLTTLRLVSRSIYYMRDRLGKLHKETSQLLGGHT